MIHMSIPVEVAVLCNLSGVKCDVGGVAMLLAAHGGVVPVLRFLGQTVGKTCPAL